ncbi:SAT1 [Branchiostoma lanceolatum]|uniref:SAT1 protein n=1 Tax=Branchiostoma lanceolatum TaxID=7740 RepID=A0A8J9Z875_BRALA|nr:SAT1 [Branchiostoma lanceolatum]
MMAPTSKAFIIRPARPDDCGEIARLIQEVEEYQGFGDKETATEEDLRQDAFGDDPYFRALVAEVPGTADAPGGEAKLVGHAMYYFCYSPVVRRVMYLENIYVEPLYRGRGIGTAIMREVAKIGVKHRCNKMQWVCLNWNDVAVKFYQKHGGKDVTVEEKWHLFRMDQQELAAFARE